MRSISLTALMLIASTGTATADFSATWKAMEIGDFQTARSQINFVEVEELAKQGNANAEFVLGLIFDHGLVEVPIDKDYAMTWYLRAAAQDNANAIQVVGDGYANKYQPSNEDLREAEQWRRKALELHRLDAKRGSVNAMYRIGRMYSRGEGVTEDDRESVKWFRRAADLGHLEAMWKLGNCYSNGIGVLEDYVESVRWFKRAAERDYVRAQRELAYMHHFGEGATKDYVKAYAWYLLAGVHDYARIADSKAELTELMTNDEIIKAQHLAKTLVIN